jgi:hypothetical protein
MKIFLFIVGGILAIDVAFVWLRCSGHSSKPAPVFKRTRRFYQS